MTVTFTTAITVIELVDSFTFEMYEDGQRGTRVYVDSAVRADLTAVNLPAIGSGWDATYPECRLRSIKITYLGDNDNCGRRFECNYDTASNDEDQALTNEGGATVSSDAGKSAMQVDSGCEFISWEPYKITKKGEKLYSDEDNCLYTWGPGGDKCKQMLFKRVVTMNISIERSIPDSKITTFLILSNQKAGKINSVKFWECGVGTLLYQGCTFQKLYTPFGYTTKKMWKGTMSFQFKSVTGAAGADGWNYILREDADPAGPASAFQKPVSKVGNQPLYQSTTFAELLTTAGLEVKLPTLTVTS